MPTIEILGTGRLDERDSAFPQAVQLPNGDILCSFNVGGGAFVHGGTDWARSTDGGETWAVEGSILPPSEKPHTSNALKLSLSADGRTVYTYGSRQYRRPGEGFGEGQNEPVFCHSTDGGRTWSEARVIPMGGDGPLEISHGILPLSSGRLLAPAATLPAQDRLGEQVIAAVSDDGGETWPSRVVVMEDPDKQRGYFEQKLAETAPGQVMAVCWTVTLGDVSDLDDSFSISNDDGLTWGPPVSTGIHGQTMTPVPLGDDRLLVLYNRRYGDQGIRMALATFTERAWTVQFEDTLYDARATRKRPTDIESGVDELAAFEFGFPTAISLQDGTYLATHWSREKGKFGIRWTKLRIDWPSA